MCSAHFRAASVMQDGRFIGWKLQMKSMWVFRIRFAVGNIAIVRAAWQSLKCILSPRRSQPLFCFIYAKRAKLRCVVLL